MEGTFVVVDDVQEKRKKKNQPGMDNPSTWEAEIEGSSKFKT